MTEPFRPIPTEPLGAVPDMTVYVTGTAAIQYGRARTTERLQPGAERVHLETWRRELTELLLDARPLANRAASGATQWRRRSRAHSVDVTAHVVREGRLLVVVHVEVRPLAPRGPRPKKGRP